jgi:hypothetical protein
VKINFVYDTGMDSILNRVSVIQDNATSVNLASYTYLGARTVIQIEYSELGVMLDLWGGPFKGVGSL